MLELTDKAEFDTAKLKDIKAVDSNAMQIESQFIALAAWMRKNYGGTMNQALKTVIPIKEKAKEKRAVWYALCFLLMRQQAFWKN